MMTLALGLALGLLGGAAFFAALRLETEAVAKPSGTSLGMALALRAVRVVTLVVGLVVVARQAPAALPAALAGLTISGLVAARRAAREPVT